MADMADMLKQFLDDPKASDKIKSVLDNLGEEKDKLIDKEQPKHDDKPTVTNELSSLIDSGIDPAMMLKMTKVMRQMNSKEQDDRTRLLYAIKPYLSGGRKRRVDNAASMMRMIKVMDLFKDDFKGEKGD
jgi:hypothetical protein